MTQGTPNFNFTFTSQEINATGKYSNYVTCEDQSFQDDDNFVFVVTPRGVINSTSTSIIYIISVFVSFFLFFISLWGAIRIPGSNKIDRNGLIQVNYFKHVKLLLGLLSYFFFVWIMLLSFNISSNFLALNGASTFFSWIYFFSVRMIFPVVLIYFYITIANFFIDQKLMEAITRNLPQR